MDPSEIATIAAECQRLSHAFACLVDRGQADGVADLFSPDGCFERRGEKLVGRDQIRQAIKGRPDSVVTRHLCSTTHVDVAGDGKVSGVTYFQLHKHQWSDGKTAQGRVAPLGQAELIGEYHDEFVRTPQGWRIRSRIARGIFRRED